MSTYTKTIRSEHSANLALAVEPERRKELILAYAYRRRPMQVHQPTVWERVARMLGVK